MLGVFFKIVWNWEVSPILLCAKEVRCFRRDPVSRQLLILGGGQAKKDVAQVRVPQEELSISHLCVFNCHSPEQLLSSFSLVATDMKRLWALDMT